MSAWGTVPTPSEPHHDACASVDTPIAPAMCAAYPSPVWTSQWPGRAEHHLLRPGRFHDQPGVGPELRAAGEHTEVQGLEVGERVVRALDEEHRLPRRDLVTVVQRVHFELRPFHAAELEDRDRLIDAAEEGVGLAEHLHRHAWAVVVLEQQLAGADEVFVGVVTLPHLLDGEVED